ncbi:C6 finger domain-containing protein [Phlyctema vagabunda]|uniref:C6 finger domain-containing protein n=1 Tax=Phlyctema vagabunda TaxID=108571 RepID=A0ABR4PLP6_9HELO
MMSPSQTQSSLAAPAIPKAAKACIKCRRLKMKCRVDEGPACRRCVRAGVQCIFKPRANAAGSRDTPPQNLTASITQWAISPNRGNHSFQSVLSRLDAIEAYLAFDIKSSPAGEDQDLISNAPMDPSLIGLWAALAQLRQSPRPVSNNKIWAQNTVKQLWLE